MNPFTPAFLSAHPPGTMPLVIVPETRCVAEMFLPVSHLSRWHGKKVTALPHAALTVGIEEFKKAGIDLLSSPLSAEQQTGIFALSTLLGVFVTLRIIREDCMCPDDTDLETFDPNGIHFDKAFDKAGNPIIN